MGSSASKKGRPGSVSNDLQNSKIDDNSAPVAPTIEKKSDFVKCEINNQRVLILNNKDEIEEAKALENLAHFDFVFTMEDRKSR